MLRVSFPQKHHCLTIVFVRFPTNIDKIFIFILIRKVIEEEVTTIATVVVDNSFEACLSYFLGQVAVVAGVGGCVIL